LTLVFGGLWLYLGTGFFRALRAGVADAGGTQISRRKRPCAFWLTIAVQAGFGRMSGVLLLQLYREALTR
jgi:hypothetical protein